MLVGGTDCTGGAGLSADISVVRMLQCYPMPVVSCITSQGPDGFRMMQPASIDIFSDQLKSVLSNVRPDAVKIGMLPSSKHLEILPLLLARFDHGPVIFDPIMAPTDGADNFNATWWEDPSTLAAFLAHVDMITPNLPELQQLAETIRRSADPLPEDLPNFDTNLMKYMFDMHLVRSFYELKCVLLTGGHNADRPFTDILMHTVGTEEFTNPADAENDDPQDSENQDESQIFDDSDEIDSCSDTDWDDESEYDDSGISYNIGIIGGDKIDTPNSHGTGCVYSTAIATLLAQDMKIHIAVSLAKRLLQMMLDFGKDWRLFESGHGPAFSIVQIPDSPDKKMPLFPDSGINWMMN